MKKVTWFLVVSLFLSFANRINSQELPRLHPADPAASELIKSIEYPISYNTGLANIEVPLYNISVGNVNLPVALKYRSSGFKKNEQESSVGLGWNLTTDIQITRVVNGLDDFLKDHSSGQSDHLFGYYYYNEGYDYYLNGCDYPNIVNPAKRECDYKKDLHLNLRGDVDKKPDKFYYSLLSGRSGAFYFQKKESPILTSNTHTYSMDIVQWPYTGVKIEVITSPINVFINGSFKITDIDGTEYYYNSTGSEVEKSVIPLSSSYINARKDLITSWKCTKIISSNKQDEINFEYDSQEPTYTFSGEDYVELHYNKNICTTCPSYMIPPSYEEILNKIDNTKSPSLLTNTTYDTFIYSKYINHYSQQFVFPQRNSRFVPVHYTRHSTGTGSSHVFPVLNGSQIVDELIFEDNKYKTSKSARSQKRLKLRKIIFPMGELLFNYNLSGSKKGQLKEIVISNKLYQTTKSFTFFQSLVGQNSRPANGDSYYDSCYDNTTAYLDSLTINSNNGSGKRQKYTFGYFSKPYFSNYQKHDKLSDFNNIDHNVHGKLDINNYGINIGGGEFAFGSNYLSYSQYSSSARYHENIGQINSGQNIFGLDKRENTTDQGMLRWIAHPTGGYTIFEYEINKANAYLDGGLYGQLEPTEGYRIKSIAESASSYFDFDTKREFVYGKEESGGGVLKPLHYNYNNYIMNATSDAVKFGDYEAGTTGGSIQLDFNNLSMGVNFYSQYKIFDYNIIDISNPVNPSDFDKYQFTSYFDEDVKIFKKNSYNSMPYAKDNHIYYDVVTEYKKDVKDPANVKTLGKTVYTYRTLDSGSTSIGILFPFYQEFKGIAFDDYDWQMGQLISKKNYKSNGAAYELVRELKNTYTTHLEDFLDLGRDYYGKRTSLPIKTYGAISKSFYNEFYGPDFFRPTVYENGLASGYVTKDSTIVKDFYSNGEVENTTTYTYDPLMLLPKTVKTVSSEGKTIETNTFYPHDVLSINSLGYNDLSTTEFNAIKKLQSPTSINTTGQHRIATPVQVETTVKSGATILAQTVQRTNYSEPHLNLILPKDVGSLKDTYNSSTNALQDRVLFENYYDNGNVEEVSKADGTSIYYIWGYQKQYPIAKIENFTKTEATAIASSINTAITKSNEDNDRTIGGNGEEGELRTALNIIRNHSNLLNAMVTTFTYDPLIGVTSITDPKGHIMYYEYDGFNRLKHVKDKEGNIISENEYNYKQ